MSKNKWVYGFGGGSAEGEAKMKNLLGGKGANLAEMAKLGLPVPPGFTITTELCTYYTEHDQKYPEDLKAEVGTALGKLEQLMGASFGDPKNPILVSIRSGARASMPGMMDTVLNLGLNDATVAGLAAKSEDERFAYDSYRRFIQMYSDVVLDVDHENFERILDTQKRKRGVSNDTELTADDLKQVVEQYKNKVQEKLGRPFPQDVQEQLWGAIGAVFRSWMNTRAITYRRLHDIPASWGTAVNVQTMVFGNRGDSSATGVAFTRSPSTGERAVFGEFLVNAQGEDVVAGIRTPQYLSKQAREAASATAPSLEETMPERYKELADILERLERHYRDMQDIEFTIQEGKLWMLQTRNGKRTAEAALKTAVDMVGEGLITQDEAVLRIDPAQLDQLLHPMLDPKAPRTVLATGLPASPGAASGELVFSPDEAETLAQKGRSVILARIETSPEDIHGMHAAAGILTTRGGMTSHAAVVARGMGRPCVAGAGTIHIDYLAGTLSKGDVVLNKGDVITIDGSTGQILLGDVQKREAALSGDFEKLMTWADATRRMRVRANAETPTDAAKAREFGAEGIGLCRTEHMFFDAERIVAVREMILAEDEAGRRKALARILPMQQKDFEELFDIMAGLPVTIRLLDPPLHEFLPKNAEEIAQVAKLSGVDPEKLRRASERLHESNPMLGHRGCRLGIAYPEIYEMQAQAIFEAALTAGKKTGRPVIPEVMIPLVAARAELDFLAQRIAKIAEEVRKKHEGKLDYKIGTMIELPRAALRAGELAHTAEFFSFGTNDLTQTTFGISRDDAGGFLGTYVELGILEKDPFVSLDRNGVGELVQLAAERGRKTRPDIKVGICGEHGGDPSSIEFCEMAKLDYVSCSPFRVPIARLAAAQATLGERSRSTD